LENWNNNQYLDGSGLSKVFIMMQRNFDQILLSKNPTLQHLELPVDHHIAYIEYQLKDNMLTLVHTEVPEALRGQGVGSAIISKALEYAQTHQLKIKPECSFVIAYIQRHPEWLPYTQ